MFKWFLEMCDTIDHLNCKDKYLWQNYHSDLTKMNSNHQFMGSKIDHVNIGQIRPIRLSSQNDIFTIADGVKMVKERLINLAWRTNNDLSNEVFDTNTEVMIEHCRVLCDLKSLLFRILEKGCAHCRI